MRRLRAGWPGQASKAGTDGAGHGYAFIAPTIRKSKVTGELTAYQWIKPPDLARLGTGDKSGEKLIELVRQARATRRPASSEGLRQPDPAQLKHAGPSPAGEHHAALVFYAGWMRARWLV